MIKASKDQVLVGEATGVVLGGTGGGPHGVCALRRVTLSTVGEALCLLARCKDVGCADMALMRRFIPGPCGVSLRRMSRVTGLNRWRHSWTGTLDEFPTLSHKLRHIVPLSCQLDHSESQSSLTARSLTTRWEVRSQNRLGDRSRTQTCRDAMRCDASSFVVK